MKELLMISTCAAMAMIGAAKADPVGLSAYVDANGFIDVTGSDLRRSSPTPIRGTPTRSCPGTAAGTTASTTSTTWTTRRAASSSISSSNTARQHQDEKIIHAIAVNLHDMRAEGLMQEK